MLWTLLCASGLLHFLCYRYSRQRLLPHQGTSIPSANYGATAICRSPAGVHVLAAASYMSTATSIAVATAVITTAIAMAAATATGTSTSSIRSGGGGGGTATSAAAVAAASADRGR